MLGANPLDLFHVCRHVITMAVGDHLDNLAVNSDFSGIRDFQQVDAAKQGALARAGSA